MKNDPINECILKENSYLNDILSKTISKLYDAQHEIKCLENKIGLMEIELHSFRTSIEHITVDGCTTRSFIDSKGWWAMIHKDRLHQLECFEERLRGLES
jgi:hypothetical protein